MSAETADSKETLAIPLDGDPPPAVDDSPAITPGPLPEPAPGSLLAPAVEDRILAIDLVRGIALLGILIMNIVSFGLPGNSYDNPRIAGGSTGINLGVWWVVTVLFEGKMRALFSMLFGAGVILMTSRGEARGGGIRVADLFIRRNLWLILLGALHGYLIWSGDILFAYGLCGLFLFPFRNIRPWVLILLGVVCLASQAPKAVLFAQSLEEKKVMAAEADAAEKAGKALTDEQKEARDEWKETLEGSEPDPKKIEEEIAEHRGGYLKGLGPRAEHTFSTHTEGIYLVEFWDTMGMMLIGMALFKLGVLSASRLRSTYITMAAVGLAIGLPVGIYGAYTAYRSGWDPITNFGINYALYDLRRLPMMLAYLALIMLWFQSGKAAGLQRRLSAVGRMALSAYLGTSVLCVLFFDGFRFFGQLQRYQLYGVVFAIWALWLVVCPLWLARFRFGPMEWLWRSLTYAKLQPLRADRAKLSEAEV